MKNIFKKPISISALIICSFFGATVHAQPTVTETLGNADHVNFDTLSVSTVQPVIVADATNTDDMFQFMVDADAVKQMPKQFHNTMPTVDEAMFKSTKDGFAFGGKSTSVDIVSLRIGYMMGALPLIYKKDRVKYNKQVSLIKKAAKSGLFDATTSRQMSTFAATSNTLNGKAYTNMLSALSKSMAKSTTTANQRKHAYMMVGFWVTLNTMSLATNNMPSYLSNVGNILAKMLDKDASFGSSDKTLAKHIRTINTETKKAVPNRKAVYSALTAMTKVQKDS